MGWRITSGPEVGFWVAKRLRCGYFAERSNAIGLERDGELVAGVIYEDWNHRSIICHLAVEGRLTPAYLAAICDYAFNVCQVEKVIAPVLSANEDGVRFVGKFGFVEEARLKDAHPEGDIVLFILTREACRFLEESYSKRLH